MDLTIEIHRRDHASTMNTLFPLMLKPDSKVKYPHGLVVIKYKGLTEQQVESIKSKAKENWKITLTIK